VCTPYHAVQAASVLQEQIERMKQGEKRRFVVGTAQARRQRQSSGDVSVERIHQPEDDFDDEAGAQNGPQLETLMCSIGCVTCSEKAHVPAGRIAVRI
jgi:hypothetical protein